MTYVVTKYIKGNPYLYEVKSVREGDRVRQVFVRYLGRADKPSREYLETEPVERKERIRRPVARAVSEAVAPTEVKPSVTPVTTPDITLKQVMYGEGLDAITARQLADGTFQVTPSYNLVSKGFERKIFKTQDEASNYISELQGEAVAPVEREVRERPLATAPIKETPDIEQKTTYNQGEIVILENPKDKRLKGKRVRIYDPNAVGGKAIAGSFVDKADIHKWSGKVFFYDKSELQSLGTKPAVPVEKETPAPAEPTPEVIEPIVEPKPTPTPVTKEPWQMTRDEWEQDLKARKKAAIEEWERQGSKGFPPIVGGEIFVTEVAALAERAGYTLPRDAEIVLAKKPHQLLVEVAIAEGKPIPPEVLKDYPELAPKPTPEVMVTPIELGITPVTPSQQAVIARFMATPDEQVVRSPEEVVTALKAKGFTDDYIRTKMSIREMKGALTEVTPEITREEFIANNSDLVREVEGRWGITHFELKTRVGDYQKVGQITSASVEGVLGKYYDALKSKGLAIPTAEPGMPLTPEVTKIPKAVIRYKRNYGSDKSVNIVEYEHESERLITGTVVRGTDKSLGWYFGKGTAGLKEANRIALLTDEEFSKAEDAPQYSWEKVKKMLAQPVTPTAPTPEVTRIERQGKLVKRSYRTPVGIVVDFGIQIGDTVYEPRASAVSPLAVSEAKQGWREVSAQEEQNYSPWLGKQGQWGNRASKVSDIQKRWDEIVAKGKTSQEHAKEQLASYESYQKRREEANQRFALRVTDLSVGMTLEDMATGNKEIITEIADGEIYARPENEPTQSGGKISDKGEVKGYRLAIQKVLPTYETRAAPEIAKPIEKPIAPAKMTKKGKKLLSASQISDFRVGIDKVVREGDRTFVIDTEGVRKKIEVQSDVMTPEFATNRAKLTPEQNIKMIESIKTTPYLSDEGRAERLAVIKAEEAAIPKAEEPETPTPEIEKPYKPPEMLSYGLSAKRAVELGEDPEYPRMAAAVFHFDELTTAEKDAVITGKKQELVEALQERKAIYQGAKDFGKSNKEMGIKPDLNPYPGRKKDNAATIERLQRQIQMFEEKLEPVIPKTEEPQKQEAEPTPSIKEIQYSRDLDIRNIEALPKGTGAKYLVTLKGQGDELIAKQWARVKPTSLKPDEVLVSMTPPAEGKRILAESITIKPETQFSFIRNTQIEQSLRELSDKDILSLNPSVKRSAGQTLGISGKANLKDIDDYLIKVKHFLDDESYTS